MQFLAPTLGKLNTTCNLGSRGSDASGLFGHLYSCVSVHENTHKANKIKNKTLFFFCILVGFGGVHF